MFKGKIEICSICGEPMIGTFMIPYCELYCLNCGNACGIFSGERIEATKELIIKQRMYKDIFKSLYKNIIPIGSQRCSCKKCKERNEDHLKHATKDELLKDKIARKLLKSFVGKRK